MINLEKQSNTSYKVLFNTKYLGMAEMDESGFYNFYYGILVFICT